MNQCTLGERGAVTPLFPFDLIVSQVIVHMRKVSGRQPRRAFRLWHTSADGRCRTNDQSNKRRADKFSGKWHRLKGCDPDRPRLIRSVRGNPSDPDVNGIAGLAFEPPCVFATPPRVLCKPVDNLDGLIGRAAAWEK